MASKIYAYVISEREFNPNGLSSDHVYVIDTSTNTVTTTISLGVTSGHSSAITPDGQYVYITNGAGGINSISVLKTSDYTVNTITQFCRSGTPSGITIAPDGQHAYVICESDIVVVDISTNNITAIFSINGAGVPIFTPDGNYLYVSSSPGGNLFYVSAIDTSTNAVTATTSLCNQIATSIAIIPSGQYAYVDTYTPGCSQNNIYVIDTTTSDIVAVIPINTNGIGSIAITPNGKYVYVANTGSGNIPGNISVIDTSTNTVLLTMPAGSVPEAVAITPDGKYAYVANTGSGNVSVINTSTNTTLTTISGCNRASNIVITPN